MSAHRIMRALLKMGEDEPVPESVVLPEREAQLGEGDRFAAHFLQAVSDSAMGSRPGGLIGKAMEEVFAVARLHGRRGLATYVFDTAFAADMAYEALSLTKGDDDLVAGLGDALWWFKEIQATTPHGAKAGGMH